MKGRAAAAVRDWTREAEISDGPLLRPLHLSAVRPQKHWADVEIEEKPATELLG